MSTTVAGRAFRIQTRAGLPAGPAATPAALLLSEYAAAQQPRVVLLCDVAYALPALVTPASATVFVAERHAGMVMAGQLTLGQRPATWLVWGGVGPFEMPAADLVLIEASATRDAWQRRLLQAYDVLAVGGTLVAAAPNDAGGTQLAKDVTALFGSCQERSKAHQRVVVAVKPAGPANIPPYAAVAGVTPDTQTALVYGERSYTTIPGVFAHGRLDAGSAYFLEHLPQTGWRSVLDLGAGVGVLSGWALAHGATTVDMVDVDGGAAWCAAQTFAGDERVRVGWHDIADPLPWDAQYDRVLVNPPFHSGRRHDTSLFAQFVARAAGVMRPRGEFWCVANAFLPYERVLAAQWSSVTAVATNGSYTVWRATGRPSRVSLGAEYQ